MNNLTKLALSATAISAIGAGMSYAASQKKSHKMKKKVKKAVNTALDSAIDTITETAGKISQSMK